MSSPTMNWTAEQKKAFSSLKRSKVYPVIESMVEDYIATGDFAFSDLWYCVTYETDYADDEPETYWEMPERQRLTPRSYRYAKQWAERTRVLCRE